MVPRTIHYCWFGGKPIPQEYEKYIATWKKYLPGYEMVRWDESNFDMHCNRFVEEAYKAGKYAFVSDYVRFWVLYTRGGVYFDTDVEVIKPMKDILAKGPYMGKQSYGRVNPGLGMAAEKGMDLFKAVLDYYDGMHFVENKDSSKQVTVVQHVTDLLTARGYMARKNQIQTICGINIYPPDYFNPRDFQTGTITITENTHTIHHYAESWKPPMEQKLHALEIDWNQKFGSKGKKAAYVVGLPYWICKKIKNEGLEGAVETIKKKTTKK